MTLALARSLMGSLPSLVKSVAGLAPRRDAGQNVVSRELQKLEIITIYPAYGKGVVWLCVGPSVSQSVSLSVGQFVSTSVAQSVSFAAAPLST